MRLHPDVYFRRYGTYTYLRHVGQKKDYLYNETAFDILNFIESHPGCGTEETAACLEELYETGNRDRLKEDVEAFARELEENGILQPERREGNSSGEESIRDLIQAQCCENNWLQSACLELTYRCNERCIHCYIDDPSRAAQELRFEDYRRGLDELRDMGCMSVLLTGGEPTLHPDFLKIAEYAREKRFLVDIYTNGLSLDDGLLDRLIALKPNSISFSFYGGTAAVHDRITGIPGSFERSLRTMMMCRCAGIDTYIKTVVMKQNAEAFEELLKLGKRLGVRILSSLSVIPTHGGRSADPFRLMELEAYRRALELEYRYGMTEAGRETGERPEEICTSGRSTLSIDPFGYVHPCNASPVRLGNIRDTSLSELWESSGVLREIRGLRFNDISKACAACPHKPWCAVCVGAAVKENGRLAPCGDSCLIAQANHLEYTRAQTR